MTILELISAARIPEGIGATGAFGKEPRGL